MRLSGTHIFCVLPLRFASKIKSGTLAETKPIHLDLFEVIKVALSSGSDNKSDVEVETEDESEVETTYTQEVVLVAEKGSGNDTMVQFQGVLRHAFRTYLALPTSIQLGCVVVSLSLAYSSFFRGRNTTYSQPAELVKKVDDLSAELKEVKAMLKHVVILIGEGNIRGEEL